MSEKTRAEIAAEVVAEFEKKHGKIGSVNYGESIPDLSRPENRLPTGVLAFDYVIGGGLVRGVGAVEVYGQENVGKSTIGHFACKYVQKKLKEPCLWIQTPGEPYDRALAEMIGIDFSGKEYPPIYVMQARSAEHLIDMAQDYVASGAFSLVVVDSIAALRPADEYEKKATENTRVGGQPVLVQRLIAKLNVALMDSPNTALFFINQQRATQEQRWTPRGLMPADPHAPGGYWLRHLLLGEVYMTPGGNIAERTGDRVTVYGRTMRFYGKKGKLIVEHGRQASADFYVRDFPERNIAAGEIDSVQSLYEIGKLMGVIESSGPYLRFLDQRVNGRVQFGLLLRDKPELAEELEAEIRRAFFERKSRPIAVDDHGGDEHKQDEVDDE